MVVDIENILKSEYSLESCREIYRYLFSKCELLQSPVAVDEDSLKASKIDKMNQIGLVKLGDDTMLLFDTEVNPSVDLERNRVALNKALAKWLLAGQNDAAICIFHSTNGGPYRFTFVRETVRYNDEGKLIEERTNSKRYTYVLGPGKRCAAAIKRFKRLHEIPNATLDDVEEAFSVEALTKEFYRELFDWYLWAKSPETGVFYPNLNNLNEEKARETVLSEHLIRLLTRLIFVWFIKQKGLVANELFQKEEIARKLKTFDPDSLEQHNYYRCYLQNLFFATLNREIEERKFAKTGKASLGDYGISALYRYADEFNCTEEEIRKTFSQTPYLNGGLFECLDSMDETKSKPEVRRIYIDGFSRTQKNMAKLPNALFFNEEKGLIPLLQRYDFTVEENSATDQTVALDPELLGKVFENLLGEHNPETQATARNASGSFYTPREIVDYMVNESLSAYLTTKTHYAKEVIEQVVCGDDIPSEIRDNPSACDEISELLYSVKILDPACGSGAFPVGALNRIVEILNKLTENEFDVYATKLRLIENCIYGSDIQTIAVQIAKLRFFISLVCEQTPDLTAPERNYDVKPLPNLETRFVAADSLINIRKTAQDGRFEQVKEDKKLRELQEKRYTISQKLICPSNRREKERLQREEKQTADEMYNHLIEIAGRPNQHDVDDWKQKIADLKKERLSVADPKYKAIDEEPQQMVLFGEVPSKQTFFSFDVNKDRRDRIDREIKRLEKRIEDEYSKSDREDEVTSNAKRLCSWLSSNLNSSADFFDPEWMFAVSCGFDIVIGNPPYIQLQSDGGKLANKYENEGYKTFARMGDIYCLFYERGWQLLKDDGHLCFITSNKWMRAGYGEGLRSFFASKTNPKLLVDFAGQKIFESATVDTNILLFSKKGKNEGQTLSCIAKPGCRDNLSGFIRRNSSECAFSGDAPWVVLTPIEQSIKRKIEAVGTPLKDWDIQINYGIKTGCNDAFIINEAKRAELIAADPKSDEIIRPILRGRDIKRYGYDFAGLYLLFVPWHFPLHNDAAISGASFKAEQCFQERYPAVYHHLLQYKKQLTQRNKSEVGVRYEWYALQRWGAKYWDDFSKQKIVWGEISDRTKFALDEQGIFTPEATSFLMTGEHLKYLLFFLNSALSEYLFSKIGTTTGVGTVRWKKFKVESIVVPSYNKERDSNLLIEVKKITPQILEDIDNYFFDICQLTNEERCFILNR